MEKFIDTRTRSEQINGEINALKQLLSNSDYKALKFAEGEMTYADYEPARLRRQELRDKINALQLELQTIGEGEEL